MIFTNDKYLIDGDFLIDDAPGMIDQEKKATWKLVRVNTPYN